jgi:uncharacterized protein (DUF4415 family)
MKRHDDSDPLDQEIDFSQARHGPVITPESDKTRITISLDTAVVDWFREQVPENGGSYQTLINEALKVHINQQQSRNDLEQTLRRVLREELDARQAA